MFTSDSNNICSSSFSVNVSGLTSNTCSCLPENNELFNESKKFKGIPIFKILICLYYC